ncbi:hypothetical protein ACHAQA_006475 [Verticillium albo-atrum]
MADEEVPSKQVAENSAITEAKVPVAAEASPLPEIRATKATDESTAPATSSDSTVAVGDTTPATEEPSALLGAEHWAALPELVLIDEETDSAVGDNQSATTSISSSILAYRTINGRTYHSERGDAQYWVSNDERSNEALDINHHVLSLMTDGKLYKAPLSKDIKKVVDIGTGTGIWAIDFADEFPATEVVGTDVSPIQPSWVPPNLQFQIDDCTQAWTFEESSLDYVHMRLLVGSIADWNSLFKEAYKSLKPGGWVESREGSPFIRSDDGTIKNKSAMQQWGPIFAKGGQTIGRPFTILEDDVQKKAMEEAGFVDIEVYDYKIPIGGWAKDPVLNEAGKFFQAAILQDIEGTLNFIALVLGWSPDEVAVFGAHYRSEIKNKRIHGYFSQRVVWGKKPE